MPMLRRVALIVWFGLAGCSSSMQLAWDYDAQAEFPVLRSYDWLTVPEGQAGSPRIHYSDLLDSDPLFGFFQNRLRPLSCAV